MSSPEGGVGRDLDIPLPRRRRVFVRIEELPSDDDKSGKRTRLREPSAVVLRLARQYDAEPESKAELLWEMAGELLPDLTDSEVEQLSPGTIVAILNMAKEPIAVLEEIAKNAAPPLVEAEKGSNSRTPSPTASRRSPRGLAKTRTT